VVGADEEVVSPKIGPPVAHCLNQADQLPLVGCQLEVASGEGSAEEGEGSDVLMKDRAKPRARRITVHHELSVEIGHLEHRPGAEGALER